MASRHQFYLTPTGDSGNVISNNQAPTILKDLFLGKIDGRNEVDAQNNINYINGHYPVISVNATINFANGNSTDVTINREDLIVKTEKKKQIGRDITTYSIVGLMIDNVQHLFNDSDIIGIIPKLDSNDYMKYPVKEENKATLEGLRSPTTTGGKRRKARKTNRKHKNKTSGGRKKKAKTNKRRK